jgi:hypothetical protein
MSMHAEPEDDPSELDELQRQMREVLYRFDCPSPHHLGEYQLGVLEPELRIQIAAHLTECDVCRIELQALRTFIAAPLRMPDTFFGRARRMIAALVPPAPGLALSGLRGGTAPSVRVYEVEDVSVTLGPGYQAHGLIGLLMVIGTPPEQLMGRQSRLVAEGQQAVSATLDDIGNFEFSDVAPGVYTLELDLPDAVVVVESVTVA